MKTKKLRWNKMRTNKILISALLILSMFNIQLNKDVSAVEKDSTFRELVQPETLAAGNIDANGDVVLPAMPKVSEVENITEDSTRRVSSESEFYYAYINDLVNNIILEDDINMTADFTSLLGVNAGDIEPEYVLSRPLLIDGQGHTLNWADPDSDTAMLNVTSLDNSMALHFKDITIRKTDSCYANVIDRVAFAGYEFDLIFENVNFDSNEMSTGSKCSDGYNLGYFVYDRDTSRSYKGNNVVFRGENNFGKMDLAVYTEETSSSWDLYFDTSQVTDGEEVETEKKSTTTVLGAYSYVSDKHLGDIYIGKEAEFKQTLTGYQSIKTSNVYIEEGGSYILNKESAGSSSSAIHAGDIYVAKDGTFYVNGDKGYSMVNYGVADVRINEGATFISKSAKPIRFSVDLSKIVMNSPAYFDIENTSKGETLQGSSEILEIRNSNISFYSGYLGKRYVNSPYMNSTLKIFDSVEVSEDSSEDILADLTTIEQVDRIVYEESYEVKFMEEDGQTQIGSTQKIIPNDSVYSTPLDESEIPEKTGYTFAGWTDANTGDLVEDIANYEITSDTIFVATYVINSYTVKFYSVGVEVHSEEVAYKGSPLYTESHSKPGYEFIGWTDGKKIYPHSTITEYIVESDVTFTAIYVEKVKPTINAPSFKVVDKDGDYNALEDVSAVGKGTVFRPDEITVGGSVDTSEPGFYTVTYDLEDSNGNKADQVTQIVLVNDGSYYVGENYVLRAFDFELRVGEVEISDKNGQVLDMSKHEIFKKLDGKKLDGEELSNISVDVTYDSSNEYTNEIGKYPITLTVFDTENQKDAVAEITATVVAGEIPEITAPAFKEIKVGEEFDPKTGVSVTDEEDDRDEKEIKLEVESDVNINEAGFYKVKYNAIDSDLNAAEEVYQIVLVNDGSYVVGDTYILHAISFIDEDTNVKTDDISKYADEKTEISIYNKTTGEKLEGTVDDPLPEIEKNYGGLTNAFGSYPIEYTITDDAKATMKVNALITTKDVTVVDGEVALNAVNIKINKSTMEQIIAAGGQYNFVVENGKVQAVEIDSGKDITGSNLVIDTSKLSGQSGVYDVTITATHSDGKSNAVKTITVTVIDDAENAQISANDITVKVNEGPTTDDEIIAALSTKAIDPITGENITDQVVIADFGGYDKGTVGSYTITLSVTGSNGEEVTETAVIEVYDGDAPEKETEANIYGTTPIAVNVNDNVNLEDLIKLINPIYIESIKGNDFAPVKLTVSDIINNSGYDGSVEGVYYLEFAYTGSNTSLEAEKIIEVYVTSDGTPISGSELEITANDVTIVKDGFFDNILTPSVVATQTNSDGTTEDVTNDVEVIYSDVDTSTLGTYTVTYKVTNEAGAEAYKTITVTVTDASEKDVKITANDITVNLGSGPSTDAEIIAALSTEAIDPITGENITDQVVIADLGGYDKDTVGKYTITLNVTGSNGVTVTETAVIEVYDGSINPEKEAKSSIYGTTPIVVNVNDNVNLDDLIKLINPIYIETIQGNDLAPVKLTVSDIIANSGYNGSVEGVYYLEFAYTGSNTNLEAEKIIEVYVTSDGTPTSGSKLEITANDVIVAIDSEFDSIITPNVVATQTDNDGNVTDVTNNVEVIFSDVDTSTPGTYTVTYKVTNEDGAEAYKTITVRVSDDVNLVLENIRFKVGEGPKDHPEILNALKAKAFDPKYGDITDYIEIVDLGGYDKDTVGKYTITVQVTGSNGKSISKTGEIEVYADPEITQTGMVNYLYISLLLVMLLLIKKARKYVK